MIVLIVALSCFVICLTCLVVNVWMAVDTIRRTRQALAESRAAREQLDAELWPGKRR